MERITAAHAGSRVFFYISTFQMLLHYFAWGIFKETLVVLQFPDVQLLHLSVPVGAPHGEGFSLRYDERYILKSERQWFEDVEDSEVVA